MVDQEGESLESNVTSLQPGRRHVNRSSQQPDSKEGPAPLIQETRRRSALANAGYRRVQTVNSKTFGLSVRGHQDADGRGAGKIRR